MDSLLKRPVLNSIHVQSTTNLIELTLNFHDVDVMMPIFLDENRALTGMLFHELFEVTH